ncbi:MAG: hypothetical protein LR011_09645 [Verrucomicrobia bacterium]|nr:hypothetical protein [Verrucomicrobiota bacterium]
MKSENLSPPKIQPTQSWVKPSSTEPENSPLPRNEKNPKIQSPKPEAKNPSDQPAPSSVTSKLLEARRKAKNNDDKIHKSQRHLIPPTPRPEMHNIPHISHSWKLSPTDTRDIYPSAPTGHTNLCLWRGNFVSVCCDQLGTLVPKFQGDFFLILLL